MAEDDRIIRENLKEINSIRSSIKLLRNLDGVTYDGDGKTVLFNMYFPEQEDFPQFSCDPRRGLACGYTVTFVALQWAFYMGFEKIYLLGVDFNYPGLKYLPNGTVELPPEGTHFLPGYGRPGEIFWAPKLAESLQAYAIAKSVFEDNGRQIFNATRGGKLEIFPRTDFDTLFS